MDVYFRMHLKNLLGFLILDLVCGLKIFMNVFKE